MTMIIVMIMIVPASSSFSRDGEVDISLSGRSVDGAKVVVDVKVLEGAAVVSVGVLISDTTVGAASVPVGVLLVDANNGVNVCVGTKVWVETKVGLVVNASLISVYVGAFVCTSDGAFVVSTFVGAFVD